MRSPMRHLHLPTILSLCCFLLGAVARAQTVELIVDLNPGARGSSPSFLMPFRGDIYFRAKSGLQNVELWRFDGTSAAQVGDAEG